MSVQFYVCVRCVQSVCVVQVYMYMCIFVKEYRILYVCAGVCAVCRYHTMLQEQKNGPPNETYMHIPYTIAQCTCTYIACAYTLVHSTFYDSTNAKTK